MVGITALCEPGKAELSTAASLGEGEEGGELPILGGPPTKSRAKVSDSGCGDHWVSQM